MTTYYIYWDLFPLYDIFKPKTDDLFEERFEIVKENNVYALNFLNAPGIYQIYARHPVLGPEALLYIGETHDRTMYDRLKEHLNNKEDKRLYIDEQDIKFRCGRFMNRDGNEYIELEEDNIRNIEKTLIAVCAPAYNTQHIRTASIPESIVIYNDGDFGAILGEISYRYHMWGEEDS